MASYETVKARSGTHKTVKARFWHRLSSPNPQNVMSCFLTRSSVERMRHIYDSQGQITALILVYVAYLVIQDSG